MKPVVVISGGSNGLGLELVKVFHKNNFYVCNIDKDQKGLNKLDKRFTNDYKSFCGDVSNEAFVKKVVTQINKFGGGDFLPYKQCG